VVASFIRIWLPDTFKPRPRPIVTVLPLVQATITEPVPSSFVLAFATDWVVRGKATGAVEIVQFGPTVAVTLRFAVALACLNSAVGDHSQNTHGCQNESSLLILIFSRFLSVSLFRRRSACVEKLTIGPIINNSIVLSRSFCDVNQPIVVVRCEHRSITCAPKAARNMLKLLHSVRWTSLFPPPQKKCTNRHLSTKAPGQPRTLAKQLM